MQSTTNQYEPKLDHLRFVAALMVLAWHIMRSSLQVPTTFIPDFWPMSFFAEGHTGVALFMVLSGYIFMALCHDKDINYIQFLKNRLLRIAPLFILWTLLYFYIGNIDPAKLIFAIFTLLDNKTVPGVGWTIIVEFQFYVIFPMLLVFYRNQGIRYLFGLITLAVMIRWTVWFILGSVQELAYSTIFGRIDQFLLGMIAFILARRFPAALKSPLILVIAVTAWAFVVHRFDLIGGYFDNHGHPSPSSVWIYFPTLEGIFYAAITISYINTVRLLPLHIDKTFAWLGMLSYSIYLNHPWAIDIAMRLLKHTGLDMTNFWICLTAGLAVTLPIVIVMSTGTYYLVEKPFLSLRTKYAFTRPTQEHHNSQAIKAETQSSIL
jgi:peptidoglycan/LPS O-acetylase OafA/YrhL